MTSQKLWPNCPRKFQKIRMAAALNKQALNSNWKITSKKSSLLISVNSFQVVLWFWATLDQKWLKLWLEFLIFKQRIKKKLKTTAYLQFPWGINECFCSLSRCKCCGVFEFQLLNNERYTHSWFRDTLLWQHGRESDKRSISCWRISEGWYSGSPSEPGWGCISPCAVEAYLLWKGLWWPI